MMVVFLLLAILIVLLIATGLHEPVLELLLKLLKWVLIAVVVVVLISLFFYFFPKTNEVALMPKLNLDFGLIIQWLAIFGFCIGVPYVLAVPIYDFLKFLREKWLAWKRR